MKIAFDVDGTLISREGDTPRYEVINMLRKLHCMFAVRGQVELLVWSGGGVEYARRWVEKLGLSNMVTVVDKDKKHKVDLAFDDEQVALATYNLQV